MLSNTIAMVQHAFRHNSALIYPIMKAFNGGLNSLETKCLRKEKSSGRPHAAEEQVERTHNAFKNSPHKSTYPTSCQLEIPHTTVWCVLKRQLHTKPNKLSLVQVLTNDDKEMQRHSVSQCWRWRKMIKPFFHILLLVIR